MFEFTDIQQNSDEWYSLRCGRVTSSKMGCVMANYGKAFGDPAKRYAKQIAVERITGIPTRAGYKNEHMERGHEEEPIARKKYEDIMFYTVSNGGFFFDDDVGCSPDGIVFDDGLIEIKSADAHIHYDRMVSESFDKTYKWQMLCNMKFTGRDWIDFISYCSDFPQEKKLYIYRLWAKDFKDEFKMIDSRLKEFLGLINEAQKNIERSKCIHC